MTWMTSESLQPASLSSRTRVPRSRDAQEPLTPALTTRALNLRHQDFQPLAWKGWPAFVMKNFVSPTVVSRLRDQLGLLQPIVDDWRALVESVAIDSDYHGDVFNIRSIDLPARRADYVSGSYTVPIANRTARIAVKITDCLGEEILVTDEPLK